MMMKTTNLMKNMKTKMNLQKMTKMMILEKNQMMTTLTMMMKSQMKKTKMIQMMKLTSIRIPKMKMKTRIHL